MFLTELSVSKSLGFWKSCTLVYISLKKFKTFTPLTRLTDRKCNGVSVLLFTRLGFSPPSECFRRNENGKSFLMLGFLMLIFFTYLYAVVQLAGLLVGWLSKEYNS